MPGIGTAFAGAGIAQPQILAAQQERAKQAALAQMFNALKTSRTQQGQPGAPGVPGAAPGGAPGAGGFMGGMPNMDQMLQQLITAPGDDKAKMMALEQYGAFASPFEKMTSAMDMKRMQLENQSTMLKERLDEMSRLGSMRDATTRRGQDTRADIANTTRDAGSIQKEMSALRSHLDALINAGQIDTPDYKQAKQDFMDLRTELENARKGTRQPTAPKATAPAAGGDIGNELPTPQTQAEFDKLAKGAHYIDPDDGKEYVK